jgi:hypothetical protein
VYFAWTNPSVPKASTPPNSRARPGGGFFDSSERYAAAVDENDWQRIRWPDNEPLPVAGDELAVPTHDAGLIRTRMAIVGHASPDFEPGWIRVEVRARGDEAGWCPDSDGCRLAYPRSMAAEPATRWERIRWPDEDPLPRPGQPMTIGRYEQGGVVMRRVVVEDARFDAEPGWIRLKVRDADGPTQSP